MTTGCNVENKDKFGNACHPAFAIKIVGDNGRDQYDLIDGYNEKNCDLHGRKKDGSLCKFEDITLVVDEETGLNQFNLTEEGTNEKGCHIDGTREDGTLCAPEDIPRITDDKGTDQIGLDNEGYSALTGCSLLGVKRDGSKCTRETTPFILGQNGLTHLNVNASGFGEDGLDPFGRDEDNCDINNQRPDGTDCPKINANAKLTENDAERVEYFKASHTELLASYMSMPNAGIGQGTVTDAEEVYSKPVVVASVSGNGYPSSYARPVSSISSNEDGQEGEEDNGMIEIPLGTAMNVFVETTVNTDYTSTVWGFIVGGELDGAKVRGTVEVPYKDNVVMPRDKIRYLFDAIIYRRKVYPINAVSMSYDDLNDYLEGDNVEYHRFQRFGGLLGAVALQSLGATYLDSEEEKAVELQSELASDSSAVLLGRNSYELAKETTSVVADDVADIASQQYYRAPTVEKDPTSVMIVFMEEVDEDELPVVFSDVRN